jgi:ribosome-associated protein
MVIKNMAESKENMNGAESVISKSQRRRDALEHKALAARLIGLSPAQLAGLPLDDRLRVEIESARVIRSNVARKRQLQFVAKLLRRGDPQPLLDALEAIDDDARHLNARHHRCEAWRDQLLQSGDTAVGALLERRRDADAQAIRQLIRKAQREALKAQPPAAARALFRLLRELDESEPLPPAPAA